MGKHNSCKLVPNTGVHGKVRPACSWCGSIVEDTGRASCKVCGRHFKPSWFSHEIKHGK